MPGLKCLRLRRSTSAVTSVHVKRRGKYCKPTPIFSDMKISSDLRRSHGVSDRRLGGGASCLVCPPPTWRRHCSGSFSFLPFSATFCWFKPVITGKWQKIVFAGKMPTLPHLSAYFKRCIWQTAHKTFREKNWESFREFVPKPFESAQSC